MLSALKKHIETLLVPDANGDNSARREHGIRLATATLMAEVARADDVLDVRELAQLSDLLRERFSLTEDETRMIVNDGLRESEQSVSLQGFTRPLHEALTADEKSGIIRMLWQVAGADGTLDKHEDALIARLGELLYVPRSEVLRQKHDAGF
ncbi:MAG: TerB family tellurite resistance protein [Pseudomonadota bacterium]